MTATATIAARFSNGHVDEYKGKRPVRAAWMVTDRETGRVLASGHSLDRRRAQSTAESNVRQYGLGYRKGEDEIMVPISRDVVLWARAASDEAKRAMLRACREAGYTGPARVSEFVRWANDIHNPRIRAARRERVAIEVVDI